MKTGGTSTRLNLQYHWKALVLWSLGLLTVALLFLGACTHAQAWVASQGVLPEGQTRVTVILHLFCRDTAECGKVDQGAWRGFIREAAQQWTAAGSNFQFDFRPVRPGEDPCWTGPWELAIMLASPETVCRHDFQDSSFATDAAATRSSRRARIYFNTRRAFPDRTIIDPRETAYIMLHEMGHIVGLGHPNESGQTVEAVMNTGGGYLNKLQPDDIAGIHALYGRAGRPAREAGIPTLENPAPHSSQSGIGVISGWVCEAERVRVIITAADNYQDWKLDTRVPYGSLRTDTVGVCGDTDNGFVLLFNWNSLGDGDYRVAVYVDDYHYKSAEVTVTTLGEEFRRGMEGTYVLKDFPVPGQSVVVEWEQSLQNFVITEHRR